MGAKTILDLLKCNFNFSYGHGHRIFFYQMHVVRGNFNFCNFDDFYKQITQIKAVLTMHNVRMSCKFLLKNHTHVSQGGPYNLDFNVATTICCTRSIAISNGNISIQLLTFNWSQSYRKLNKIYQSQ